MSTIRYKQSSYILVLIYGIIIFTALTISIYKIYSAESSLHSLLTLAFMAYIYAVIIYEKMIPIFYENSAHIWLDRGLIKKRIRIKKSQITHIEALNLNGEFIKLIISLENDKKIDYMPPIHASFALEEIYFNIRSLSQNPANIIQP